jgi:cyclic dehypoxanthinyl futalosine synthase
MEENVVSAAGTTYRLTEQEIRAAITDAGWIPKKRNCYYEIIETTEASYRAASDRVSQPGARE